MKSDLLRFMRLRVSTRSDREGKAVAEQLLKMQGIEKRFSGVYALRQVDFTLDRGEVRGLIGENGAGKSTLMKVLGGDYQADAGCIYLNGRQVDIKDAETADQYGISFIHQELALFPELNIATNIFIQHLPSAYGRVKTRDMYARTRELLDEFGLSHCRPEQTVGSLQIGEQQLVEIMRCLAMDTKILVLDEPTSSLTSREVETLFRLIRRMREKGVSIVFISHRLDELFEICDSITVMRDGAVIDTVQAKTTTQKELIHMMLGRDQGEMYEPHNHALGPERLRVEGLTHKKRFRDISFSVHAGEIVGLYGLLGSGRSEIVRSIYGLEPFVAGSVYVDGKKKAIKNPTQAGKLGIGLVTEDRRVEGLCLQHSVQRNLTIACVDRLRRLMGYLDGRSERKLAEGNIRRFNIATDKPSKVVRFLSGGNQQKVVIAKWLNIEPNILILDEPTRGVDVGAKKEIYSILGELAQQGMALLVISSELNEVINLCDRVLVLRKGDLVAELSGEDINKERLLATSMGGD